MTKRELIDENRELTRRNEHLAERVKQLETCCQMTQHDVELARHDPYALMIRYLCLMVNSQTQKLELSPESLADLMKLVEKWEAKRSQK